MKFVEIDTKDAYQQILATTSPILQDKDADYVLRMRKTIKNSFPDKLSVLKGQTLINNYESDDPTLRAKSYLYRVPSLMPPQLSFEIADKISQQNQKLLATSKSKTMSIKSPTSSHTQRVHSRFTHRSTLKQLELWLNKKLSNIPSDESDILEYKNIIVGLGMKELIRLLKTRCQEEGDLLETIWQTTWKVCQQIIHYLNTELNRYRSTLESELNSIEKLFVNRLAETNGEMTQLNEKLAKLQKQNESLNDKVGRYTRTNKELKMELTEQREHTQRFQKEYIRVLEDNLTLQLPNQQKRDWIKRMYQSVKCYKSRVANQMKSSINKVAIERAQMQDEKTDIDFELIENVWEQTIITAQQQSPTLQVEFATKNFEVQVSTTMQSVKTQTSHVEYSTRATQTVLSIGEAEVQTMEDWVSHDLLLKMNLKIKKQKEILQQQLRAKPHTSGYRISRKESSVMPKFSRVSAQSSQSELSECAENSDEHCDQVNQSKDLDNSDKDNLSVHSSTISPAVAKHVNKIIRKGSIRERSYQDFLKQDTFQLSADFKRKNYNSTFESTKISLLNKSHQPKQVERDSIEGESRNKLSQITEDASQNEINLKSNRKRREIQQNVSLSKQSIEKCNHDLKLSIIVRRADTRIRQEPADQMDIEVIAEQNYMHTTASEVSNDFLTNRDYVEEQADEQRFDTVGLMCFSTIGVENISPMRSSTSVSDQLSSVKMLLVEKKSASNENQIRSFKRRPEVSSEVNMEEDNVKLADSDADLLTKLQKFNFQILNRIKCTRHMQGYKDILKQATGVGKTTEKKMELAIDRGLIPVLLEMLKYYRKIRVLKPHSAKIFLKNMQPLPVIIIQRYTQKYGVKALAVKHLRQILSYTNELRHKSPRYQLLHLLLFSDLKIFSADTLRLFIKLLNVLDPHYHMLKESIFRDKDIEQVELRDINVASACSPFFQEAPPRTLNTLTIGEYMLYVLNLLLQQQSVKVSRMYWIFNAFSYGNLRVDTISDFVISLNFKLDKELLLLKDILNNCDSRTNNGKYELTEEKFVSLISTTKILTYESVAATLKSYDHLYIKQLTVNSLTQVSSGIDGNSIISKRLAKYLSNILSIRKECSPQAVMAWQYLQYYELSRKVKSVTAQLLGPLLKLSNRQVLIGSNDAAIFQIL